MTRPEVYELIDGERAYQNLVEQDPTRCNPEEIAKATHSTGEYYCMMMAYINQFPTVWCYNPDGDPLILEFFRKIGAICVHAIEDHGCPPREVTSK